MEGLEYFLREVEKLSRFKSLGRGARFPSLFSTATGGVAIREEEEKVRQSIGVILRTKIGEVGFVPEFGSKMSTLVFEPNDDLLRDLAELYIREAIERWERRVVIKGVELERGGPNENSLFLVVNYSMRANPNYDGYYRHEMRAGQGVR